MIDEVLEDEEIRRITSDGGHLPMLACRHIDFSYGQLQVLFDVDFTVDDGEMVALLGTNGAGKSTLLKVISGIGLPSAGSVRYRGADITYLDAERRLRLGITQIPGGRAVFGPMTVVENLRVFGYTLGRDRKAVDAAIDRCFEAFPRLAERRNQNASTLSGGEQQMLGLGKALILRPALLLIDELSLGLAPVIVGQLLDMVRQINADGTAVVLVEQSVNIALSTSSTTPTSWRRARSASTAGRRPARPRRPAPRRLPRGRRRRPMTVGSFLAVAPFGFNLAASVIALGVITGLTYGLLAVGLVLVYRTNRIINFAHGEIGAFGAAVFGLLASKAHIPYYLALPLALALAGATGATAEVAVIRRLRRAPKLMSIVATLGVGQFLVFFSLSINAQARCRLIFPEPARPARVQPRRAAPHPGLHGHAALRPVVVIALAVFLRRQPFRPRHPRRVRQPRSGAHGGHLRRPDVVAGLGARRSGVGVHRHPHSADGRSRNRILVRTRLVAPRPGRCGAGPHEQPARRAGRRRRARRGRAAAAVELPALRPGRGRPVRPHPRVPCLSSAARGAARRRREVGRRSRRGGRCPSALLLCPPCAPWAQ